MANYGPDTIEFRSEDAESPVAYSESTLSESKSESKPYPEPILKISKETETELCNWLDEWLMALQSSQSTKINQWAQEEEDYRAKSLGPQSSPFIGASGDVVPAIAMAVDPIHARLDTGIFKSDPIFRVKPLKKSTTAYAPSVEAWINYYAKNKLELRKVVSPRILEMTKHGTMVLKTVYEHEKYSIMTYDSKWEPVKKEVTRFKGPKVYGISLNDILFPPSYQDIQRAPIVAERQRVLYQDLMIAQSSGKIKNCEKLRGQEDQTITQLESARQDAANHRDSSNVRDFLEIFECWCDYDINGDSIPERLVITYHAATRTILQLRYNWYFHQRKPYTVIPYSITNDSLYGIGIAEMVKPFQDVLTQWQRQALNNGYLANVRMWATKKGSAPEGNITVLAGKNIPMDDPSKDIKELKLSDIYASSINERQNLFGLSEKRTGVSDYLTGRESPIVGSRATATSTLALIQEGTRRVEEVLENLRAGLSEVMMNCVYIWMQYGTDQLDDIIFGDDKIAEDLKDFFENMTLDNVTGGLAVDLSATDAADNRSAQQQVKLSIIQVMMQYLEKVLQAGEAALAAAQTQPIYTQMVTDVMTSARNMFKDLLTTYDIRNPEEYLPDLEKYLNVATAGSMPGAAGPLGGPPQESGMAIPAPGVGGFAPPSPPPAANNGSVGGGLPFPGIAGSVQQAF